MSGRGLGWRACAMVAALLAAACGADLPACELDVKGTPFADDSLQRAADGGDGVLLEEHILDLPGLRAGEVAFNPGLARLEGRLIGVFRVEARAARPFRNVLAVTTFDASLAVDGPISRLATRGPPEFPDVAEDPRLIVHMGALWLVYNAADTPDPEGPRAVRLARLSIAPREDGWHFAIAHDRRVAFREASGKVARVAENWSPFVHRGELHFLRHASPLEVVRVAALDLAATGEPFVWCQPVSSQAQAVPWRYGLPRGGTPAVWDPWLGRFVTFFHSRRACRPLAGGAARTQHLAGAYAFSASPPFRVEALLPRPLVTPAFLEDLASPERTAHLPTGLLVDGDDVKVGHGRNNRCAGLMVFDRRRLFGRLVPVERESLIQDH